MAPRGPPKWQKSTIMGSLVILDPNANTMGRLQKKLTAKKMTLCKKGGVSEKYQIMNVLLKSDILLGEGG